MCSEIWIPLTLVSFGWNERVVLRQPLLITENVDKFDVRATVSGGIAGGCEYSGGGVFAVRVVGDYQPGRFRVQFSDDDQPQLLVTTTCPSGRYVAPQGLLATGFSAVEVEERAGAAGRAAADGATRGALEMSIAPQGEVAPP